MFVWELYIINKYDPEELEEEIFLPYPTVDRISDFLYNTGLVNEADAKDLAEQFSEVGLEKGSTVVNTYQVWISKREVKDGNSPLPKP